MYSPKAQDLTTVVLANNNSPPLSGSVPRQEKLTIGYHNYPLKGLNLRYMYCSKNTFLNKLEYINIRSRKWCSY